MSVGDAGTSPHTVTHVPAPDAGPGPEPDAGATTAPAVEPVDAAGPPVPVDARPPRTGAVRAAVVATLPIYIASRLAVLLVAKSTTWLFPQLTVTGALSGWDGGWYIAIAANGYPDSLAAEGGAGVRWAFFPGLPAVIRAVSEVTGLSPAVSGIVLSTLLGAVAVAAIWIVVRDVLGPDAATATATLMCFFPVAYVLSMVYTESIFLVVSTICLYATIKKRWITAGLMASAASIIRAPGLALVILVGVAVLRELWARRISIRMIIGLVLAGAGFGAWAIYQWVRLGSPLAYLDAQKIGWYNEFSWFSTPFRSLWRVTTDRAAWSEAPEVMAALALLALVASAGLAVAYVRRHPGVVPVEWWVYSGTSTLFAFAPYWPTSILRYCFAIFPLYAVALAQLPKRAVTPVLCVSATMMAVFGAVAIGGLVDWQNAPFAP